MPERLPLHALLANKCLWQWQRLPTVFPDQAGVLRVVGGLSLKPVLSIEGECEFHEKSSSNAMGYASRQTCAGSAPDIVWMLKT